MTFKPSCYHSHVQHSWSGSRNDTIVPNAVALLSTGNVQFVYNKQALQMQKIDSVQTS